LTTCRCGAARGLQGALGERMFARCTAAWYSFLVVFLLLSLPIKAFLAPQTRGSFTISETRASNEADTATNYAIEQVRDRQRALDVSVFRSFSISATEYQQKLLDEHQENITEQEAVEYLTKGINDAGQQTGILGGPLFSFVAVCEGFGRTHGVVAAVDAKLNEDHVYLKNLAVDEQLRRRGVASALVTAVKSFTETTPVHQVVLHVDRQTNVNAVALYLKEGFDFEEEREGDGRMVFRLSDA